MDHQEATLGARDERATAGRGFAEVVVGVEPMDEGVEDEIEAPGSPLVGAGLGSDGAGQAAQAGGGSSAVPPVSQAVPLEAGSSTGGWGFAG